MGYFLSLIAEKSNNTPLVNKPNDLRYHPFPFWDEITQQGLILTIWTVFKSLILSMSDHNSDILTKALFISRQDMSVCV